ILTRNNLFIGRVAAAGVSDAPNPGQLENATKMELGTLFDDDKVKAAVLNILAVLRENGFYLATVTPELEHIPEYSEVNITFYVEPGPRARYDQPIITGNLKRDPEKLMNAARWKRWLFFPGFKAVSQSRTQSGLERMRNSYHKDKRLMAKVTLEDLEYHPRPGTLTVTVGAEAGPKVDVRVEGARISGGKLKDLVPVFEEQSVDNDLLYEGERNIVQYLQSLGYFDAQVDYARSPDDPAGVVKTDHLQITYSADRGPRSKLVAVDIAGNKYFDTKTVRERMFLLPAGLLSYRHGRFSEQYLERDKDAILNLYRANGFRDAKVVATVDPDYNGKTGSVGVTIGIEEGPQWFVGKLDLTGDSHENHEDISSLLRSTEGQPFSDLNIAADRDNVLNYYYDHGYPGAQFETTFQNAPEPNRVNIRYTVKEGARQFVRGVVLGGLHTTDRALVTERISLAPGDPLSRSSMVESQRRLYDLGIFAKVSTAIQNPEGIETNKFVLYQLEEARRWVFNFGFGAEIARIGGGGTTDLTQPSGGAGFSPRGSFGVTRYNLFGIGHSLGLQTQISTILKRGILTYQAPQFEGNDNVNLTFTGLFDDSRNVRTFSAKREEISAQLGQRLSKATSMQYRVTYRRVSVDENTLNITPQLIPLLSQPVRIGMASTTFIQDRRDDPIDSTRGAYNTLDVGVATKALASQNSFLRLLGKNSTYHRVGNAIIARSLTFG
ncbi:MAG: BamA/TamA family outer membrane protein, partial [Acidobacteria bacterium]|nr:BamA/TamA family outer membrane protein [Acidobacteriota bacterium]